MHSFRTVARMEKQTFMCLVTLLRSAGLDDTPHISVEEKILVLIQVCVGLSNRQIAHRFQHSGDTISHIVRQNPLHDQNTADILIRRIIKSASGLCGWCSFFFLFFCAVLQIGFSVHSQLISDLNWKRTVFPFCI